MEKLYEQQLSKVLQCPVRVFIEQRKRSTASFRNKKLYIKLAQGLSQKEYDSQINYFEQWALKQLQKNNASYFFSEQKKYEHGTLLTVRGQQFLLQITEEFRKNYHGKIIAGTIFIETPLLAKEEEKEKMIKTIIIQLLSNYFYKEIAQRLIDFNEKYFKKRIQKFTIKYMSTRWGSCTSQGNISLSSRLLLAPDAALDYVLVHELAHLHHMNHSAKFWGLVASVLPEYKTQEKWLKENNYAADY